ncbi:hypothetical protein DFH07DRAFT_786948 [Mycena maculata]|uniref:Uncharacterized protein n=1 Tax=Mycena maculata TaxID=230809 RepID=A0AAD7KI84_9AGAR|nr:hypothetical protein DFH07DRAFT_786948 [Mycena maculata]
MKITNPSTANADTGVVVTYTTEAGDPSQFFFEVVENGSPMDFDNKQAFSGSGTFITIPGYVGPHFIEAYNSTAVVGENPPFAVGPTYTVLPPSSTGAPAPGPTSTSTPTGASLIHSLNAANVSPTTFTTTTTSVLGGTSVLNDPTAPSSTLSGPNNIFSSSSATFAAATGSVITMYDSIMGSTGTSIVVQETLSSSPSTISFTHRSKPINIGAIIGASIAGVFVLAMIIIFLIRRYKNRQKAGTESRIHNFSSTINPFLAFSAQANGKKSARLAGESRTSLIQTVSPSRSSHKATSASTDSTPRVSLGVISAGTSGPQMEWVLRPTNDPPPEYDYSV